MATQPPLGSGEWSGTDEASGGEVSIAAILPYLFVPAALLHFAIPLEEVCYI